MELVMSSGHGKYVSGAIGILNEVTEARRVVSKTVDYLKELGATVYEYHDNTSKNQKDNINTIVKYHNNKNRDIDVSVHFNAYSKTNEPRGVEVLYYSDSQRDLAAKVSKAIANASGLKDRGAKKRDNLGFLKGTKKPALLIEVCFVDSKADADIYKSKFDAICKAVAEALTGKKISISTPKPEKEEKKVSQEPSPRHNEAVEWAKENKISDGSNPKEQATREQVIQMIHNYEKMNSK